MSKILVIEDKAVSGELFIESLKAEGFDVIYAENGIVGVNKAQLELPDLIVSDIIMSKLDGYGVLKTLRENPTTAVIPFIFYTNKASKADIRQGMIMGADDYLVKPSSIEELLETIAIRLERQAFLKYWYTAQLYSAFKLPEMKIAGSSQMFFSSNAKLRKVFDFIEANYHRQITAKDVAKAVDYSCTYLSKLVRSQTGQSLQKWIIQRRIVAASSLLAKTSETVEQIAELVGYQHPVHFFRQFRQYYGTTPQAWRKTRCNNS